MPPEQQQPVTPTPPATPAVSATPVAPIEPVAPAPAPATPMSTPPKKSKKGLIIGLIIGATVLLFGGIFFLVAALTLMSPSFQTKNTSDKFMAGVTTGNISNALAQTDGSQESKSFIELASGQTRGEYSLLESTSQNENWYYLYSLTNATNKFARTTVQKTTDGKYEVTAYVYGPDKLALVPGVSSDEPDTSTSTTPTTTTASACLVDSDLTPLNNAKPEDEGFGTTFKTEGYRTYVVNTYFFEPDSTTYTYPDQDSRTTTKVKTFYDTNKNKQFTIHLSGKVKESASSSEGVKLSNDRANKVKADLVAAGVPADRVVIEDPRPNSSNYDGGSERNVSLTIRTIYPCTAGNR